MKLNVFKRQYSKLSEVSGVARLLINERRLSAANVERLRERYLPLVIGQQFIVIQFDRLAFIDSSGLGFLVGLRNSMVAPQAVVLEGITDPSLLELLALTRMDQVFKLSKDARQSSLMLRTI